MANVWPATQSQLYGELNKLANAGLIEVSEIGPRGRKEYQVTDAGRTELLRWITDPSDDPPLRLPDLLRVFLLDNIPTDEARKHVMAMAEYADSELDRLGELRDAPIWDDGDASFFARAALEFGLRNAVTEGTWARWLLAELDKRTPDAI